MSKQHHQSDPRVLSRRTLEQDHRVLAGLLAPGMSVLDVGCGNAYGTALMAESASEIMGLDYDQTTIDENKSRYSTIKICS